MKNWFGPIATAWTGVISHKLRSFLTILGIVIGVGAVITLMSVGSAVQGFVEDQSSQARPKTQQLPAQIICKANQ